MLKDSHIRSHRAYCRIVSGGLLSSGFCLVFRMFLPTAAPPSARIFGRSLPKFVADAYKNDTFTVFHVGFPYLGLLLRFLRFNSPLSLELVPGLVFQAKSKGWWPMIDRRCLPRHDLAGVWGNSTLSVNSP